MIVLIIAGIVFALGVYAYIKALIILNDINQLLEELHDNNLF